MARSSIKRPRPQGSAISRALGIGQVVASVLGAAPTGGASLAALPSGLQAVRGQQGAITGIDSGGPQVAAPGQKQDGLGALSSIGNIAGLAGGVAGGASGGAPSGGVQAGIAPKQAGPMDRKLGEQQQVQDFQNVPQEEAVMSLGRAEQALNALNDPELNSAFRKDILQAMMIAKQRINQGQQPFQPGNQGGF